MLVDSWRAGLYLALPFHRRPDDGLGARVAGEQCSDPRVRPAGQEHTVRNHSWTGAGALLDDEVPGFLSHV